MVDILESNTSLNFNTETLNLQKRPFKSPRVQVEEHPFESLVVATQEVPFKSSTLDVNEENDFSIERDPGLRIPMWDYPVNQRDKIRRAYLKARPYQFHRLDYPLSGPEKHPRRFQASWFTQF